MRIAGRAWSVFAIAFVATVGRGADLQNSRLPLRFEENVGQSDERVRYLARGAGYGIYITDDELVTVLAQDPRPITNRRRAPLRCEECTRAVVHLRLIGSKKPSCLTPAAALPGKSNYFIGNDPAKWRTEIQQYAGVRLEEVYRGVDLVYRGSDGRLEYDFVVRPGGDARHIRLRVQGADDIRVDASGDLILRTAAGELRQRVPTVYQDVAGEQRPVKGAYRRVGRSDFAFELGPYDSKRTLVIDPAFVFATYFGGSSFENPTAIRLDGSGNSYITGFTSSTDFPTQGPLQGSNAGGADAFVTKIDSSGAHVLYSTYLGGSNSDQAFGIAIDGSGNVYLAGSTQSTDFPTMTPIKPANTGTDAFVAKLNTTGSALVYSTYWGGTGTESANAIAVDGNGNAYVGGSTTSADFPDITVLQSTLNGTQDAFVTMFTPNGTSVIYSMYLGGSGFELVLGIAVDASGNAYVTGETSSADFPTAAPLQPASGGGALDAFVTEIHTAGTALTFSTYLGGSGSEFPQDIALDGSNNVIVVGSTTSTNFPTVSAVQSSLLGGSDGFVSKINAGGSALTFSTYLGGQSNDGVNAVSTDGSGNIHAAGYTTSHDFPSLGAVQSLLAGLTDAFATTFSGAGTILFSTLVGGSGDDYAYAIAVDGSGNDVVVGSTASGDFPTQSPIQAFTVASQTNFLLKIVTAGTLTLSPEVLPDAKVGTSYTTSAFSATGGTGPYTFSLASGSLPVGMYLNSTTASLAGTPIAAGWINFTIRATDSLGAIGDRRYSMNVLTYINAPRDVSAIATSTTNINVTWTPVSIASSYRIYRKQGNFGSLTLLSSALSSPFSDSTVIAARAYLYVVTAVTSSGDESSLTSADYAHTYTFTDAPISAGDVVKAVDIIEIRGVVQDLEGTLGVLSAPLTDSGLAAGTLIKAAHINELRTEIDKIRSAVGLPPFNYAEPIVAGSTTVKAAHIQSMRNALR